MDEIYREELKEIYRNPAHKGTIKNATVSTHKSNSMCGDDVNLELKIENDKITDAKFNGNACAVSVISSDLLAEEIIGKTVEEAKKITKDDLLKLLDLNLTTSRVKCATLVLSALKDALNLYEEGNRATAVSALITKDINLGELIQKYPQTEEVLYDYGLHCVGCALSAFDTLEAGAKVHGLTNKEIDEMAARLNEVIKFKE